MREDDLDAGRRCSGCARAVTEDSRRKLEGPDQRGATSGLKDMSNRIKRRERLRTRSVALGQLRIAGVDNIGEALAVAQGEAHK